MNVEFEAALRYIDLGETAKAEEHLIKVVEKAKDDVEEFIRVRGRRRWERRQGRHEKK